LLEEENPGKLLILRLYACALVQFNFLPHLFMHKKSNDDKENNITARVVTKTVLKVSDITPVSPRTYRRYNVTTMKYKNYSSNCTADF
jgi:hypothetical protein